MKNYYSIVTVTDRFLSGWGRAENMINKLVFICQNEVEEKNVIKECQTRRDFVRLNVASHTARRPKFTTKEYIDIAIEYGYAETYREIPSIGQRWFVQYYTSKCNDYSKFFKGE